jgi:3-methyladenine DNA glycosylase/8-oxoguanine DNA glycosylase
MSRLRFNWDEAVAHLRGQCPPLAGFIDAFGKRRYPVRSTSLFQALARSIAYQQLSGKAAGTIHGRFEGLFHQGKPNAEEAVGMSVAQLRSVGLSQAKTLSILDLAEKTLAGDLPGPRQMAHMHDQQLIDSLCQVRGIGPWTAQMHLIFYLGRPDVMPATDLGVQKGVQNIYRMDALPAPTQVLQRTDHLGPYRSAAAWYFWRASETVF